MNTWNDIEHGFGPARATQYTTSDTDQLAATLYKLFHGRYVKSDNGHIITLSDGTSLTITLADGNASENAGAYNRGIMCAHADRRIIERAHLHTNTNHAGTITGVSLILFYQGETMPATIRAAHADIATGTFATARDRSKPLATIRVALTQKQIDAWVKREQQALAVDADNFTNSDDEHYKKHDSGRVVRAWVETTSEFTDTNGMNVPQVTRTITLWVLAERNLRPEKIAEVSGEYAAHSDLRPTLIIESSDGTTISAADAALEPQW